eukprot:4995873-Pyramimonas_sp.AAC.1
MDRGREVKGGGGRRQGKSPCCGLDTAKLVLDELGFDTRALSWDVEGSLRSHVEFIHKGSEGVFVGRTAGDFTEATWWPTPPNPTPKNPITKKKNVYANGIPTEDQHDH